MKRSNRVLALLLVLTMVLSLLPTSVFAADAADTAVASGTCGDQVRWSLDEAGTLTISGTGAMADYKYYSPYNSPWYDVRDSITSVVIEPGVTRIGEYAFDDCSAIVSASIPDGVTSIGNFSFYGCEALKTVDIPEGVTMIDDYAFFRCSALESVDLPESLTSIGSDAFAYCSALQHIAIPKNVSQIGSDAFAACRSVSEFEVESGNANFCAEDGVLFTADKTRLIQFPLARTGAYTIPDGVTHVYDDAFKYSRLEELEIADSVISLGDDAIVSDDLKSLVIGAGVWDGFQDWDPFEGLESLRTLTFRRTSDFPSETWYDDESDEYHCRYLGDRFYSLQELENLKTVYVPEEAYQQYYNMLYPNLPSKTAILKIGEEPTDFQITDGVLISYHGSDSVVTVPDAVTSVGENAFRNNTDLTEVILPQSVKTIGDNAFSGCTGLTAVTIPEGVWSIGESAFSGCSSLPAVALPESVTSLGEYAFYHCSSLAEVTLPSGLDVIKEYTFYDCESLPGITLPEGLTSIGQYAFSYCESLSDIALPKGLRGLGENVFSRCKALKTMDIPDGLSSLGDYMFYGCSSLTHVSLPDGLREIGDFAFYGCSSLSAISIPDGVTSIGNNAFWKCSSLAELALPANLTSLGKGAFSECTSLTAVAIPQKVTTIGSGAFEGCTKLTAIQVANGNTAYCARDGVLFDQAGTTLLQFPAGKAGTYTIPSGVKTILSRAFSGCTALTEVTVPGSCSSFQDAFRECTSLQKAVFLNGVSVISDGAFYDCTGLAEVVFPDSLRTIDCNAFTNCTSLAFPQLPAGLQKIESYAFSSCRFSDEVVIPDGVQSIGWYGLGNISNVTSVVFGAGLTELDGEPFSDAENVQQVTFRASAPPEGFDYDESEDEGSSPIICTCIESMTSLKTVYVPDAAYDTYVEALSSYLPDGAVIVKASQQPGEDPAPECLQYSIQNGEVTITKCAASAEGELVIPGRIEGCPVTAIGREAFSYTPKLRSVVLPNTVRTIGYGAFENDKLTAVTMREGLRSIGEYAFAGSALESVSVPASVTEIGKQAFFSCKSLQEIQVSDQNSRFCSVDGILFNKDRTRLIAAPGGLRLETYEIPAAVTQIDEYAMAYCPGLKQVTIPDGFTELPVGLFCGSGLTTVTIPASVTHIKNYAFNCEDLADVYYDGTQDDWNRIVIDTEEDGNYGFASAAFHFTEPEAGPTYEITGGEVTITGFTGTAEGELVIPAEIEGCPVTEIGAAAFKDCVSLTSVSIPANVRSIGAGAFAGCSALKAIRVDPENAAYADVDGVLLTKDLSVLTAWPAGKGDECTVPDGVVEIGVSAFENCSGLKTISLPASLEMIMESAFSGSGLQYIIFRGMREQWNEVATWPQNDPFLHAHVSFTANPEAPFLIYELQDKKAIIVGCDHSAEGALVIPDALDGCPVTFIDVSAFGGCGKLTSITVPNSVTGIASFAFVGCKSLTEVNLPENLQIIPASAFSMCESLSEISIPVSVMYIEQSAFSNTGLTDVWFGGTRAQWDEIDISDGNDPLLNAEIHFTQDPVPECLTYEIWNGEVTITKCDPSAEGELVIPAEIEGYPVTTIGYSAFGGNAGLTKITLPESITAIKGCAFAFCGSLAEVNLPEGLTSIGNEAFKECPNLTGIAIPESVREIGVSAFNNCSSLTLVTIPAGVTNIGNEAFAGCEGLEEIQVSGENERYCSVDGVLFSKDRTELYQVPGGWSQSTYEIPDGVKTVHAYAFSRCQALTNVTIPESVTSIGVYAFSQCRSLTEVVIPDSVTDLDYALFADCSSLKSVTLPSNLTSIGPAFFRGCSSLEEITIPAGVTSIGMDAFNETGLKKVVFAGTTKQWKAVSIESNNEPLLQAEIVCLGDVYPEQIVGVIAAADETSIHISWGISAEIDTTVYRVYRRAEGEQDFTLIREITSRNTLSCIDRDVQADVTYEYAVTGVNADDLESPLSEIVSAKLLTDVVAPRILKMTPAAGKTVNGTVTFAVTAEDNVAVASCLLFQSLDQGGSWQQIGAFEGATGTAALNTAAIPDGELQIKAVASDAAGNESDPFIAVYRVDNTGPEQVTGLEGESTSVTITLRWNDVADDDIAFFRVEQKQADGSYETVRDVSSTLGLNLYNLDPGYTGTWRVVGYDTLGNRGVPSEDVTVTTLSDATAPVITSIQPHSQQVQNTVSVSVTARDEYAVKKIILQTSLDNIVWTDVISETYDTPSGARTLSHELDLSGFDEGLVYVRGVAEDFAGNRSDESSAAPFVQHQIDRTAPAVPQNVTAKALDGAVEISWTPGEEADLDSYVLYRADAQDAAPAVLERGIDSRNTFDRSVVAGQTYYYLLAAVDQAGNESARSAPVAVTALADSEAPQIFGISPASGTAVGPARCTIHVLATDNRALSHVSAEYSLDGVTYTALPGLDASGTSAALDVPLPLDGVSHGDTIHFRAWCTDAAGNRSETASAEYQADLDVPAPESASAKLAAGVVTVSWQGDWAADLAGYRVYRAVNGGSFGLIAQRAAAEGQSRWSVEDSDLPRTDATYTYRIEAADQNGNTAAVETDALAIPGVPPEPVAPTAALEIDAQLECGVQYLFDASGSTDDKGIASYAISFGDGSESHDSRAVHAYQQTGTYTVRLTVTDVEGLTSVVTKQVEVRERTAVGKLRVHVTDENGASVSNASVYFDLGEPTQVVRRTDGFGYVTFTTTAGRHLVGSFIADNQWLPTQKSTIVSAGEQTELTLVMVRQPMIEGEFDVHRMTFEEIQAAGIDVYDPENQHIVEVTFRVTYQGGERTINLYTNPDTGKIINDDPIRIDEDTVWIPSVIHTGGGGGGGGTGGGTGGGGGGASFAEPIEAIAILEVPARASCLKEFFDVKLHIINNAGSEFRMENNHVKLNVPNGLSIMNTVQSEPSAEVYIPSIPGQTTKTIDWVLRGDMEGDYDLSADYSGVLSRFNEPVDARFATKEPIHVNGMSAMKIIGEFNSAIENDTFYFNLSLQNIGDADMYMPNIDVIGDTVTSYYYKAHMSNETVDPVEKQNSVRLLNTVITNSSGFSQNIGAGNNVTTLTPNMTLTKKYAAYQVTDHNDLMLFKEACYEVARGYGMQVEIRVTDMPHYSYDHAKEKTDALVNDPVKRKEYYDIFGRNSRYFYIQESSNRDSDFWDVLEERLYTEMQAVASLDFSYSSDELRQQTRTLVVELLQSEPMQQNFEANLASARLAFIKDVLGFAKSLLREENYASDTERLEKFLKSSSTVRKTLVESDAMYGISEDSMLTKLGYILLSAGVSATGRDYILDKYQSGAFSEHTRAGLEAICGNVSDIIGGVANVIEAWDQSEELMTQLMQIASAEDEANWLLYNLYRRMSDKDPMYKELKAIEKELDNVEKARKKEFLKQIGVAVGQEIGKDAVKAGLKLLTKTFAGVGQGAQFGSVYTLFCIAFQTGDYLFDWKGTVEDLHMLRVETAFTYALSRAFRHPADVETDAQAVNTLRGMKYLLEMYMIGEKSFGEVSKHRSEKEQAEDLQWINSTLKAKYKSVDEYVNDILSQLMWCRDSFYATNYQILDIPEAPSVTLNYLTNTTNESFDSRYEYSYDGVEWHEADGQIPFEPGITARWLRVRMAETDKSPAGNITSLTVASFPRLQGDFTVLRSGSAYRITGLPNGAYRYAFTNTRSDDLQLNRTFTVSGGPVILSDAPGWTYLAVAASATASSPASRVSYLVPEEPEPPLQITAQPQSFEGVVGDTAAFHVDAQGVDLSYQWQYLPAGSTKWSNSTMSGAKTPTLTVEATAARSGQQYRCVVTDFGGESVTSSAAALTVLRITQQPVNAGVVGTDSARFTVKASGANLTYQWQYRMSASGTWKNCSSATQGYHSATLTVAGVSGTTNRNGYQYRCVVTNGSGKSVTSNAATLRVLVLTAQPVSASVVGEDTAQFTVTAKGTGLQYQWQYRVSETGDWTDCAEETEGSNTATLTVAGMADGASRSGWQFRCVVTDASGQTAVSEAASLTVLAVTAQPESTSIVGSEQAEFTVEATGSGLTYQWQYRTSENAAWANCSSATQGYNTPTLTVVGISNGTNRSGYQYRCVVTDVSGSAVISEAASLTVFGIRSQPKSASVTGSESAKLTVKATGEDLAYRWQYRTSSSGSWKNCSSATQGYNTATLTVVGVSGGTNRNGYQYRCVVTNGAGDTVTSSAAKLTVLAVRTQPKSASVTGSETAVFTVKATGSGLKYQWQFRTSDAAAWKNCTSATAGYNTASLTVVGVSGSRNRSGYQYRCVITDSRGKSVTSDAAVLTVLAIRTQPKDVLTALDGTATFTVSATGDGLRYRWQYKTAAGTVWNNCTSATAGYNTDTLQVVAQAKRSGYQYRCVVTDSRGQSVTSEAATLTVSGSRVVIVTQPESVTAAAGTTATISVEASGANLRYQWQYKTATGTVWNNCTSATAGYDTDTLQVAAQAKRSGYQYRCIITDGFGNQLITDAVKLTVQ